jgi:hypothetical protein
MFDPAEQEWTELTGMVGGAAPLGRRFHGLAAVGDQLYIFGGYNINLGGLTPAHAHTLYTRKHAHTHAHTHAHCSLMSQSCPSLFPALPSNRHCQTKGTKKEIQKVVKLCDPAAEASRSRRYVCEHTHSMYVNIHS